MIPAKRKGSAMIAIRIVVLLASAFAVPAAGAVGLDGVWLRDDGNARVRIAPCGDKTCATNLWIGDPSTGEAVGDRLVLTLSRDGDGAFSGTAYDPKRDRSYSMTIRASPGGLTMRGCLLGRLICRNVNWKAVQ